MPYLNHFQHPAPTDAGSKKLLADVETYGWHVLLVEPDPGTFRPPFAYTVGLYYTVGHPEIAVAGLPSSLAARVINNAGRQITGGHVFRPLVAYPDLIERFNVLFRLVPHNAYPDYLGYAMWFYRSISSDFPCLQLLWPDCRGHYPGQPGFDEHLSVVQFLLEADQGGAA